VLKVSIISPEKVLFEGEAESVVVPAFDGELGILRGHAPLMTLVGNGVLRLRGGSAGGDGAEKGFVVSGGFLQVADDNVRVVTENAAAQ
jgi:F-type H+-transporting ATPase subunit epsilon